MIIAQITDIHLGFDRSNPDEVNRQRLDHTLRTLIDSPNRPDLLIATGDLTEHGDLRSYEALKEALATLPFPAFTCLGNHDRRANFSAVFPDVPVAEGFVQYAVDLDGGPRLILLDTLEEGRHGGAFCAVRAAWLSKTLDEAPDVPTLIVMHHPPMPVGIGWMDPGADEPWITRFREVIAGRPQIVAILCGHLHRNVVAPFHGTTLAVCAATAVQLGLDLRPIDPEIPDGRDLITLDPPAYALHRWHDGQLVTHFAAANDARVLARYDGTMQPMVREMFAEKQ